MKTAGMVLAFLLLAPFSASAGCVEDLAAEVYLGRPLSAYFHMELKKLSDKQHTPVLSLTYTSPKVLTNKEEEQLYYRALYRFDDLLVSKKCAAATRRVFALFPHTTLTISTGDLKRIRAEKIRPAWEAHVLARSQVVHGK